MTDKVYPSPVSSNPDISELILKNTAHGRVGQTIIYVVASNYMLNIHSLFKGS